MTKSQNTKNEQQKDLCITSEQLTEQFNHGLLPDGWYYYKSSDGRSDITTEYGLFCIEADNKVKIKVLTKVPSYEEWQSMDRLEKIMLQERSQLNKQVVELLEETTKLKELLKECKYELRGSYTDLGLEDWSLITKIDQALGEDK